jgi:hypothetical protein
VTRTILDTLLTETASHVGAEELKGSKAADGNRFVVRTALCALTQRYSHEVVMLILSLDHGTAC